MEMEMAVEMDEGRDLQELVECYIRIEEQYIKLKFYGYVSGVRFDCYVEFL